MEDPSSPLHCQVSDGGGVHSHITHLYAFLETAKEQGIPECHVHFFGDSRDTAPRSANKYAQELLDFMDKLQYGKVATIVERYYAMDRDKRWERVETAVEGLVNGDGENVDDAVKAIEKRYEQDETDEFLKPIILGGEASRVKGECGLSTE
jgi:2,3-bisphosphoglycerate-independent phosphoglycerate mutase